MTLVIMVSIRFTYDLKQLYSDEMSFSLKSRIIAQGNIQRSLDRTIKKGQILKDILVRAKLPQWLLQVDGSCTGLSPHHYYHINFRIVGLHVRAVLVVRKKSDALCRFLAYFCGVLRFSDPPYAPLLDYDILVSSLKPSKVCHHFLKYFPKELHRWRETTSITRKFTIPGLLHRTFFAGCICE